MLQAWNILCTRYNRVAQPPPAVLFLLPFTQKVPNILIQKFGILGVAGCAGSVSPQ